MVFDGIWWYLMVIYGIQWYSKVWYWVVLDYPRMVWNTQTYKCTDGRDGWDGSLGGRRYKAPYGAKNTEYEYILKYWIWIHKPLKSNKYQDLEQGKLHTGSSVPLNRTNKLNFLMWVIFILFVFQTLIK